MIKFPNRIGILVFLLLLSLSLAACSENPSGTADSTGTAAHQPVGLFDYPQGSSMQVLGETSQGYYFLSASFVYFCDRDSDQWVVLCNRPDCTHTDDPCNAFFGGNKLYVYHDALYTLGSLKGSDAGGHDLIRMQLDGTNHEVVAALRDAAAGVNESGMLMSYRFHQGYLIVSINTEDPGRKMTRSRLLLISLDHPSGHVTTIAETRFPSASPDPKVDQTLHFRSAAGDLVYYFQGSVAKAWSISQETTRDLNDTFVPAADENPLTGSYYQEMTLIRNRYLLGTTTLDLASGKSTPLFNPNDLADGQDGIWYCDGQYIYLTNALIRLGKTEQLNLHIFDMAGSFVQSVPVDIKEQGFLSGIYTDASDRVFWVSSNSPGGLPDWTIDKAAIGSSSIGWRRMHAPGDRR